MSDGQLIDKSGVRELASLELNTLLLANVLSPDIFQGTRVKSSGTPIYDINGEVLFHRIPIMRGNAQVAYADIAVNAVFSAPLLAVSYGQIWDEATIIEQAKQVAERNYRGLSFNQVRFVAYSYPKIAVQFLQGNVEVLMLEWISWLPVPPADTQRGETPPSNFERWSLVATTTANRVDANRKAFNERNSAWEQVRSSARNRGIERLDIIDINRFEPIVVPGGNFQPKTKTRELHYSKNDADHHPCYELRGQLTNKWCVAASVQMLLDFYRYNYDQIRIAAELKLGTLTNPNGLPYARIADVVTVIEKLTNQALDATMNTGPKWSEFVNEINANRPLISFIPGHSRTIAGYTETRSVFIPLNFNGLLVYDPWPPSNGVITRWENFDSQSYFATYTAKLKTV
ncbi:MAG TPA: C39 family peptidase [Aggregatilineales bacterium]|nr:C39 family peptidase [Aggregatilineales bacterium]